jgi:hypothetical protein
VKVISSFRSLKALIWGAWMESLGPWCLRAGDLPSGSTAYHVEVKNAWWGLDFGEGSKMATDDLENRRMSDSKKWR